ncbi:MAG: hypothetical protein HS104_19025 [Polyangiaceae bacterium]|nr:hypothetical protein [Polyangiaceae bacterium]MCE7892276.1 hypothetical protein [Sorangiineae bacterium PRO1]MCL4752887.1 hypothetical protein [Myxococcales bacterium]
MSQITESIAAVNPVERHDIYRLAHKGLRSLMSHVLLELGRLDAGDPRDVAEVLGELRLLLGLCLSHLTHENAFIHAAMEARRPGSAGRADEEHVAHERALERLESLARAVERADEASRARACHRLYAEMGYFVAENLEHMLREETEHNAVLWACYTDQEILEIEHALVGSIAPDKMMSFMRWMLPAMSPAERARMLSGIRAGAPPEVFAAILAGVEPALAPRDREKLEAALALSAAA